jgi:hypothetical protein
VAFVASFATAVSAGVVLTGNRKSRVGTPSVSAALAMFPHESAKARFANSIEIFSQLWGDVRRRISRHRPRSSRQSEGWIGCAQPNAYAQRLRIRAARLQVVRASPSCGWDAAKPERHGIGSHWAARSCASRDEPLACPRASKRSPVQRPHMIWSPCSRRTWARRP